MTQDKDKAFDDFLKRKLVREITPQVRQTLGDRFNQFEKRFQEEGWIKHPGPGFALKFKYAAAVTIILFVCAGLYFKYHYLEESRPQSIVSPITVQPVCLEAGQCDVPDETPIECLTNALKACFNSMVRHMGDDKKITIAKIDSNPSDSMIGQATGRQGKGDHDCVQLRVVMKMDAGITGEEKHSLAQRILDYCPVCSELRGLACVSYKIME